MRPVCGSLRSASRCTSISSARSITRRPKRSSRPFDSGSRRSAWPRSTRPSKRWSSIGAATRLSATDSSGSARYDARSDNHYHFRCLRSGTVHDLPTHFDPHLIDKLDPHLAEELARQGFHVLGYRLELVGYRDGEREPLRPEVHEPSDAKPGMKPSTPPPSLGPLVDTHAHLDDPRLRDDLKMF